MVLPRAGTWGALRRLLCQHHRCDGGCGVLCNTAACSAGAGVVRWRSVLTRAWGNGVVVKGAGCGCVQYSNLHKACPDDLPGDAPSPPAVSPALLLNVHCTSPHLHRSHPLHPSSLALLELFGVSLLGSHEHLKHQNCQVAVESTADGVHWHSIEAWQTSQLP